MIKLTVYFENPYWVGVFESTEKTLLRTAKVTFGSEPKDSEVYRFILKNFYRLQFGEAVETKKVIEKKINHKKMIREVNAQMRKKSIGTKAQQAIKLEQEKRKTVKKKSIRKKKSKKQERVYNLRQEKKKQKKKGR